MSHSDDGDGGGDIGVPRNPLLKGTGKNRPSPRHIKQKAADIYQSVYLFPREVDRGYRKHFLNFRWA
jgi:hypothetical protein